MRARAARLVVFRALPLLLAAGLVSVVRAAEPAPVPAPAEKAPANEKVATADPLDLGRGLRYLRLGPGAADEPELAAALAAPALVLDLRMASDDPALLARLRKSVAGRDATRPLFVLLGPDTPATVRAAVPAAPGVLTLAARDAGFPTSVAIAVDPARDRAAAEALAAGRPPRELIEEKVAKTRYDEQHLAQNHANGRRDGAAPAAPAPAAADTKPAELPLQDTLLQRAVFIHRALLALGRIPEHT